MDTALGMVEVRGFLAAVAVTDAMLKAADVRLQSSEKTKGGLTTVIIRGDVGAVRASIEAGVEVARQLNGYLSHHVIARVDKQTNIILTPQKDRIIKEPASEVREDIKDLPNDKAREEFSESVLSQMKVVELRSLATSLNLSNLTKKEIKFANKELLIRSISAYGKERK